MNTIKQIRQQVVELRHPQAYKQVFAPLYQKIQTEVQNPPRTQVEQGVQVRVGLQVWARVGWTVNQGLVYPVEEYVCT